VFESNQSGIETNQERTALVAPLKVFESNQSGIETKLFQVAGLSSAEFESNQSGIETTCLSMRCSEEIAGLNRTRVELKLLLIGFVGIAKCRLNRTRVELKLQPHLQFPQEE